MTDTFSADDLRAIFTRISAMMTENRDYLIELDAATGDGDLGLTMMRGFAAVVDALSGGSETDLGAILARAGMAMAQAAPSTMGTLMATGMLRAGKALAGKTALDRAAFTALLAAFEEGVMARGKSKPGERTVIDALHPALESLHTAAAASPGEGLGGALSAALQAAREGVEATKTMTPVHGRPVYHKENAAKMPDQGAVAGMLFIQGFADYANG
jgi:dihydroxyacetone kinase-like protein